VDVVQVFLELGLPLLVLVECAKPPLDGGVLLQVQTPLLLNLWLDHCVVVLREMVVSFQLAILQPIKVPLLLKQMCVLLQKQLFIIIDVLFLVINVVTHFIGMVVNLSKFILRPLRVVPLLSNRSLSVVRVKRTVGSMAA